MKKLLRSLFVFTLLLGGCAQNNPKPVEEQSQKQDELNRKEIQNVALYDEFIQEAKKGMSMNGEVIKLSQFQLEIIEGEYSYDLVEMTLKDEQEPIYMVIKYQQEKPEGMVMCCLKDSFKDTTMEEFVKKAISPVNKPDDTSFDRDEITDLALYEPFIQEALQDMQIDGKVIKLNRLVLGIASNYTYDPIELVFEDEKLNEDPYYIVLQVNIDQPEKYLGYFQKGETSYYEEVDRILKDNNI